MTTRAEKIKMKFILQIDVGGQRMYRTQWAKILTDYFDDIIILIYIVAVSEFDQVLEEDAKTNRIKESEDLFHGLFADNVTLVNAVHNKQRTNPAPLKDK